jgi:Cft2 family RNA processing exonuclease
MSALSLMAAFDHPRGQSRKTSLGQISKALYRAFGEERLISYMDDEGRALREQERGASGSAAIEHPQIYGTPGTPSPGERFQPCTLAELSDARRARGLVDDAQDSDDAPATAEDDEDDEPELVTRPQLIEALGEDTFGRMPDSLKEQCTVEDLEWVRAHDRLLTWEPDEPVPTWVPESVRRRWVTVPGAVTYWQKCLDKGNKGDRARLTAMGVRRKGGIAVDSLPARRLAQLITQDRDSWLNISRKVLITYIESEEYVPQEDVLQIITDPVTFYIDGGASDLALFVGLALQLDETELKAIADDVDSKTPSAEVSAAEDLKIEVDSKAAQAADLRRQLKDTRRELKQVSEEKDQLTDALERLRGAEKDAGSLESALAGEQALSQASQARVAELEAELDSDRDDAARVEELTSQVEALEQIRDQLLTESTSVERERELRVQAEAQVQQELKRAQEMTRQLRERDAAPVLPVEDAPSLITALRGPIAAAAANAAGRLASGTSDPDDARLLAFAGEFANMADSLTAQPTSTAARSDAPALKPSVELSAEPVVSDQSEPSAPVNAEARIEAPAESEPSVQEPAPVVERRRRRRLPEFTVKPLGGAGEVGGSALLVQTRRGANVLLDAGQRVKGEYGAESTSQFHYGVTGVDRLHAILISHAHIDHIGSLPLIHRHHSDQQKVPVPVLMSEPTYRLGEVMLQDSAKIQHFREMTLANLAESDFGEGAMEAAYTVSDVSDCLDTGHMTIAEQYRPIPIEDTSLVARFLPVSHVLGSCAIHLTDTETGQTLLYSGDLGPITDPQITLPDFGGTQMIDKADVVIMESTYGHLRPEEREGRRRASDGRERATKILADIATKTLGGGGHMLLPAFSLGRTQELAMIIQQERGRTLPDGRIYLAGMGEKITEIYDNFDRPSGNWRRPGEFPQCTSIRKWLSGGGAFEDVVVEVLESEPSYIIASPAMLSSGWSRAFLHAMIDHPEHAIVFTGYLPKHAGNIPQLREMHQGANMRLDGENRRIICSWDKVSLSAHAPSFDLEQFARDMATGRDMTHFGLVHGALDAQRELAERVTHQLGDTATVRSLRNGEPWIPGRS